MRTLPWIALWLVTLGTMDIRVRWSDGWQLDLKGWPTAIGHWWKRRSK